MLTKIAVDVVIYGASATVKLSSRMPIPAGIIVDRSVPIPPTKAQILIIMSNEASKSDATPCTINIRITPPAMYAPT